MFPRCRRRGGCGAKVRWLVRRLAEEQIQQRRVVGLNDEEKDLFKGNVEERRAENHMAWVTPYAGANEVRIPWNGRGYGDLRSQSSPLGGGQMNIRTPRSQLCRHRVWRTAGGRAV